MRDKTQAKQHKAAVCIALAHVLFPQSDTGGVSRATNAGIIIMGHVMVVLAFSVVGRGGESAFLVGYGDEAYKFVDWRNARFKHQCRAGSWREASAGRR